MFFNWPGLGRWLVTAIRQQDYSAISAGVMVVGSMVIIVNVLSDIVGAMSNPMKHKVGYASLDKTVYKEKKHHHRLR